jgi:hypothetical protein
MVEVEMDDDGLSKDTIFSTLSNQRRRHVLHYMKHNEGPVRIRDLAEQIAAWENGIEVQEISYKQRKRVYTSLHQTHLPKLDDVGIVSYDRNRGTITLEDRARDLEIYLEVVPENEVPWSHYYLGIAAIGGALVAAGWFDLGPFGLVPDIAYAILLVLALAISSSIHALRSREGRIGGGSEPADSMPTPPRTTDSSGEGPA